MHDYVANKQSDNMKFAHMIKRPQKLEWLSYIVDSWMLCDYMLTSRSD